MCKNWQDKLKLLNEPKWSNRIIFYSILFVAIFIVPYLVIQNLDLLNIGTYPDSARYMLSALVQSLAAVIALVITLSLVAVQLAAQSYSSRVIDLYKKSPDMWILIVVYISVIFYGLALTRYIGSNDSQLTSEIETLIIVAYLAGFFAFVSLIPYTWNTLALLNPSTVIQLLAEHITEQKIQKTEDGKKNTLDENSPLIPIIDIITESIMKYDYATVRTGTKTIVNRTSEILNKENEENFSHHICKHIERLSMLALKREDEECADILIISLERIGEKAAENKLKTATNSAVVALRKIGEKAAENKLEMATNSAVKALHKIGLKAAESKLEEVTEYAVLTLHGIGLKVAENKLEKATTSAVLALRKIGRNAAENKLEDPTEYAVIALGEIGEKAAENKLETATKSAVVSLHEIWGIATENELDISEEAYLAIEKIKQKQNKSDSN